MSNTYKNIAIGTFTVGGNLTIGDTFITQKHQYEHIPPDNSVELIPAQPASITHFVGRETLLETIKENFESGKRIQVLHGMMGIGKRRLVYEYLQRARSNGLYQEFVWVIDFKGQQKGIGKLLDLFDALELGEPLLNDSEKGRRLFNWLSAPIRSGLLILANASNYDSIIDCIPEGYFHVLITTENPDLGKNLANLASHAVGPLNETDSIKLLSIRSNGKMEQEEMHNLATNLEGYPFFLEQFGALFAANLLNIKNINQVMTAVAPKEGAVLEERRLKFLNILFAIAGLNERKSRLTSGIAELSYLLKVMAYAPIPRDFIIQYGAHLVEEITWGNGVIKQILKPVKRWMLRRRERVTHQKIEYLSKLAQHSLIFVDDKGLINMHWLVHDFFKEQIIYPGNRIAERYIIGENLLEYVRKNLKISNKKTKDKEYAHLILPHAISIADHFDERYQSIEGLDLLYRRIGDFYESDQRLSTALIYFVKALNVQKRQKNNVVSKSLVREAFMMSVHAGRIKTYNELKQQFSQEKYLEEYQILLCEALKCYAEFDHQNAKSLLKIALEKVPENTDKDALKELQVLLMVVNPEPKSPENDAALDALAESIIEEYGERSERYATFLLLRSEARSRQAEQADEPEDLLEDARILVKKSLSILIETQYQNSSLYWAAKIGQLDYERRSSHTEEVRGLLSEMETHKTDIENHLGTHNYMFAAIELAKAYLSQVDGDNQSYLAALKEGLALLELNFPDQLNHPVRKIFESLLMDEMTAK